MENVSRRSRTLDLAQLVDHEVKCFHHSLESDLNKSRINDFKKGVFELYFVWLDREDSQQFHLGEYKLEWNKWKKIFILEGGIFTFEMQNLQLQSNTRQLLDGVVSGANLPKQWAVVMCKMMMHTDLPSAILKFCTWAVQVKNPYLKLQDKFHINICLHNSSFHLKHINLKSANIAPHRQVCELALIFPALGLNLSML